MAEPDSTEIPNLLTKPKQRHTRDARDAAIERVVTSYETFMHRLMATHAPEVSALDLTMSQMKTLYVVLAAGQLRMSDIAARLGVTSSTATEQVDRLVELGLLERRTDPADRRHVVVSTTLEAAASLEHLRELNTRRMRELLVRIDADDLASVERAITALAAAMDLDIVPATTTDIARGSLS
jgi:DNA-binding MarR family transcriptional regulator